MLNIKNIHFKSILQLGLTIIAFLIMADIFGLILYTIFPVFASSLYHVSNLDLLVSILLMITLILNNYIFKTTNFLESKYSFLLFVALLPFSFIYVHIFGAYSEFSLWVIWLIFRIIHIIALTYSFKLLGSKFVEFTHKNNLDYEILITFFIFILCTIGFFISEVQVNPNVINFEDAIWYAVASISSTGFGDIVPVTNWGRLIGIILMITGLVFASFTTASVASSIISDMNRKREISKNTLSNFKNFVDLNFQNTQSQLNEINNKISLIYDESLKIEDLENKINTINNDFEDLTEFIQEFEEFYNSDSDLLINDKKLNSKSNKSKKKSKKQKKNKKSSKNKSKKSKNSSNSKKKKSSKNKSKKSKNSSNSKKKKSSKNKSKKSKNSSKSKNKKSSKNKSKKSKNSSKSKKIAKKQNKSKKSKNSSKSKKIAKKQNKSKKSKNSSKSKNKKSSKNKSKK